tara:strand:- start:220 stop:531 length:312 start_codon:yes stop_codon:yes gene_type:complete
LKNISKDQILASSSGWVASLLNFLPGLGTGYIYQRRWLPYFLTAGAVIVWFLLGIFLQGDKEATQSDQLIGLAGLFFISVVTVIEANLAYKKSAKLVEEKDTK